MKGDSPTAFNYAWGSNLTSAGSVPRDPGDFTTNWPRFGARVPVSGPGCPGCPGCPVLSCPCIQPFRPSISSIHQTHPSHPSNPSTSSISSFRLIHSFHPSTHPPHPSISSIQSIHPHHPSNMSDASNVERGNEMGLYEAVWANFRCNMNSNIISAANLNRPTFSNFVCGLSVFSAGRVAPRPI